MGEPRSSFALHKASARGSPTDLANAGRRSTLFHVHSSLVMGGISQGGLPQRGIPASAGAPSMGAHLQVKVLPQVDHDE